MTDTLLSESSTSSKMIHSIGEIYRYCKNLFSRLSEDEEVYGIALLVFSQFCNAVMITTCKLLVTDPDFDTPVHPLQILFIRMSMTYLLTISYMVITRSVPDAPFGKPEVRVWLVWRGVLGFMGVFGMYFSLMYLSVSDAVAITFLVPLVTAFLACVLLHERYSLIEGICSIISLGGVLLIAKPAFIFGTNADEEQKGDESNESSSTEKRLLATGVGLLGVFGASSVYIILRKIGHSAHPLISVSYHSLCSLVVSTVAIIFIPSISFVMPETGRQWTLFVLIGVAGFIYQAATTAGIQRVKASKASLMVYLQMIFAILGDLVIMHHLPGLLSVLGIVVIVVCTFIVMKYKPFDKEQDIEGQHHALPQDEDPESYKPDDIQLQDFTIDDDEFEDDSDHNQLNSIKYSPEQVKLNQ